MIGNLPFGAQYENDAPWNDIEVTCPECDGRGEWFTRYDEVTDTTEEIEWEEFNKLSPEEKKQFDREYCPYCDGLGHIYR